MTEPTIPSGISTAGETPTEGIATPSEAQDTMASFRAHAEAALNSGSLLNKLGDDWFVSIGELSSVFQNAFDTPETKMKTFEHFELIGSLGLAFFQKIIGKIREMEDAGEDPWDAFAGTMTLKVLLEDGTVSTRDIQLYEDFSAREKLPETEGINFQIQSPREWFWRKVPMENRPADYLTRE